MDKKAFSNKEAQKLMIELLSQADSDFQQAILNQALFEIVKIAGEDLVFPYSVFWARNLVAGINVTCTEEGLKMTAIDGEEAKGLLDSQEHQKH